MLTLFSDVLLYRVPPPKLPAAALYATRFEFLDAQRKVLFVIRSINSLVGLQKGASEEEWFDSDFEALLPRIRKLVLDGKTGKSKLAIKTSEEPEEGYFKK